MATRVRVCGYEEAESLMEFIRRYWSPNHVLGGSRALLDWQHRDADRGFNFVLAHAGDEIVGILGFIPSSRYDKSLASSAETVWLTTWKVRNDVAPGLGFALLRALDAIHPSTWIGTVGLNPATQEIYRTLGYDTGTLARHYLLNPELEQFRLAVVPSGLRRPVISTGETQFTPLTADEFLGITAPLGLDACEQVSRKTPLYLLNRYLYHPFYRYRAWLGRNGRHAAVLITRECIHAGATALRVVDFLGSPEVLAGAGGAFRQMLVASGAEYLDFYCSGLGDELAAAGLRVVGSDENLILASHFEPFELRNVDLLYAIKGPVGRLVICKGDADQDRPNQLKA